MARTLLGILQYNLRHDTKAQSQAIRSNLRSIETEAKRLGNAPWGSGFQRQLDKLKLSPAEHAAIVASYDRLAKGINGKISKADFAAWKSGVTSHLVSARAEIDETRKRAEKMHAAIIGKGSYAGNLVKSAMVAFGAYTLWYGAGMAMREGFMAGADRQREFFRQRMSGIPEGDMDIAIKRAQELALLHPSVGMTENLEMFRTARNTMGNTQEGLAILEELTRGLVTLQSSQGPDAANTSMLRLIRGLDNLGINSGGEIGLEGMKEVIAGAIRAAQIEGGEIDVGQYFEFARRSKIAGPALSNEFLATTAPVLMQDMTASTAGNAVAMFFKAFITGAKDTASKVNLQAQEKLGIRTKAGLVDSQLAGEDPYQWTKKYLVPALQKAGVDLNNEVAVAKAIADLSRNSNATGLLTRMVTQSNQIERLIGMYGQAMGPDAADIARSEDPYVSAKGFSTSLQNLAAAFGEHVYPIIVPGMNTLTDNINIFAKAVREADGAAIVLTSLAAVIGLIGAVKVGKGLFGNLFGLGTAGVSLQKAAVDLTGAAAALRGSAGANGLPGELGGKKGGVGGLGWGRIMFGSAVLGGAAMEIAGAQDGRITYDENGNPILNPIFDNKKLNEQASSLPLIGWLYDNIISPGQEFVHSGGEAPDSRYEELRQHGLKTTLNPDITVVKNKSDDAKSSLDKLGEPVDVNVTTSRIDAAISKLKQLKDLQRSVSSGTSSAADQVESSLIDYGINY